MNVFIVYAHPEPKSFNGLLRDTAIETLEAAGHEVVVSDLYAQRFLAAAGPEDVLEQSNNERFDLGAEQMAAAPTRAFAPEIQQEMERVFAADLLILQFPMWWFSVPGILKSWIDRVFAFGVAYDFGRTWDKGVFAGKRAMLSFTTGAPPGVFEPDGRSGDLERVLWPLHGGVLALCGFSVLPPFVAWAVPWVGDDGRAKIVADYAERLSMLEHDEPLFFHSLSDFGENHQLKAEIVPATPAQHRGQRFHLLGEDKPK